MCQMACVWLFCGTRRDNNAESPPAHKALQ